MQLAAAQQQIQTSRAESLQWQEQHRAASQALTTVRAELEATRAQHDALLTQLRQQSEELAQVHQEAETAKKQRATVQRESAQWHAQYTKAAEALAALQGELQGLRKTSGSRTPTTRTGSTGGAASGRVTQMQQELLHLQERAASAQRRVNSGKLDRPLPCKT